MDGKDKIYDIDGSVDWRPSRRICRSGEAVAEWPSCIQVDNGTPSTPPFRDSDNYSCDESKPSEMYRDFTWMVEKFSQVSKIPRLISEAFEVSGYKWCILMFPQGSDLCNQFLSLYLCVANHTQLLPDNIHRFCKKEHAVGWHKFIELSKLQDGFLANDTLKIKAQVQIIRKRAHRLFHCLDHHYRRELLVRYLSRVQQVCCKFIEDQKSKVRNFLKDKARWSRFCTFWSGMDPNIKLQLSRERAEVIFKVLLKHFFAEREVTSALVMDSLYSGLKALQVKSKCKGGKENVLQSITNSRPIVYVDGDMFILADDLLSLLEKSPRQSVPLKDDKESSSQSKAGSNLQDRIKGSFEWEERLLTEFGHRIIEEFVLSHIFSQKIELAYQEAIAARIQEDLMREEDEAREAELEQKAKRADKEKRQKKKKNKQKRSRDQRGQRKVEKGDHENYNICDMIKELSGKSTLHSAKVFNQCDDYPDLRDYDNDDSSVWLTVDDIDGCPVTECSAKSYTCLSGESCRTELGFPCYNESMPSTPLDGIQPLEMNEWSESIVSDNGSWNMSVRKNRKRHKVTSKQIRRTADTNGASTVITKDLGCENPCSGAYHSANPENAPDGLLKDPANQCPHVDKVEHSTSLEVVEESSVQLSVVEASPVRICTNRLTSNMNPKVMRNSIKISAKTEFSTLQASPESSSKKRNGHIPIQIMGKDDLKTLYKVSLKPSLGQVLEVDSGLPLISQAGHAPKAEAATVGYLQSGPSQLLPSRASSPSPVTQFHDNVDIPKALAVTGPSLLLTSNCSEADSTVQHSLAPPIKLPFDISSNDWVPGLTFGTLSPEDFAGEPQLKKASAKGPDKVLESPKSNASQPVDQSASNKQDGLAGGSIGVFSVSTRSSRTLEASLDDFPHIDIINYLFEEDTKDSQVFNIHCSGVAAFGPTRDKQAAIRELPQFSYSSRSLLDSNNIIELLIADKLNSLSPRKCSHRQITDSEPEIIALTSALPH